MVSTTSWKEEYKDFVIQHLLAGNNLKEVEVALHANFPSSTDLTVDTLAKRVNSIRKTNEALQNVFVGVRYNVSLADFIGLYNDPTLSTKDIRDTFGMNYCTLSKALAYAEASGIPVIRRKVATIMVKKSKSKVTNKRGATLNYTARPVKRAEEQKAVEAIVEHGGFFGLTNSNVIEHWEMFNHLLRPKSPFFIAERDPEVYSVIKAQVEALQQDETQPKAKNIVAVQGDLFSELRRKYANSTKSLFRYGHLDFCNTALTLVRDGNLINDLTWLANSTILKDVFYMDITFVHRMDHSSPPMYDTVLNHFIPSIFSACGWMVSTFEDKNQIEQEAETHGFYKTYHENFRSAKMVRGFFKFERNY
jgi:hypothetical protein